MSVCVSVTGGGIDDQRPVTALNGIHHGGANTTAGCQAGNDHAIHICVLQAGIQFGAKERARPFLDNDFLVIAGGHSWVNPVQTVSAFQTVKLGNFFPEHRGFVLVVINHGGVYNREVESTKLLKQRLDSAQHFGTFCPKRAYTRIGKANAHINNDESVAFGCPESRVSRERHTSSPCEEC